MKKILFIAAEQLIDKLEYIFFNEYEKVCVLVKEAAVAVPVHVCIAAQKENCRLDFHLQSINDQRIFLAFLVGKLHNLVDENIQFCFAFQHSINKNLIELMSQEGRKCSAIDNNQVEEDEIIEEEPAEVQIISKGFEDDFKATYSVSKEEEELYESSNDSIANEDQFDFSKLDSYENDNSEMKRIELMQELGISTNVATVSPKDEKFQAIAKETIKNLNNSGNRPSRIELLKQYISHYSRVDDHNVLDKVIQELEDSEDIRISQNEVTYNSLTFKNS